MSAKACVSFSNGTEGKSLFIQSACWESVQCFWKTSKMTLEQGFNESKDFREETILKMDLCFLTLPVGDITAISCYQNHLWMALLQVKQFIFAWLGASS